MNTLRFSAARDDRSSDLLLSDGDPLEGAGREAVNERRSALAKRASSARQKIVRRRRVDPTTGERDYSPAEVEFMRAMQEYKESSGRMFPTWSETLEVLRGLGYHKPPT